MEDIRVLIGYSTVYGRDISHELTKLDNVTLCYNASDFYCYEEENSKIINFNQDLGRESTYDKVFDLNKLPALSKEIMERMLPYESMAIKLGMRRTNYPTANYEEEKINYHKHLRFWNYIFEYYKINAVFFEEFPHVSYTYVIYCLARVKNIPILMLGITSIPGIRVVGNSIEDAGSNIQKYYENTAKYMNVEECILSGKVAEFYNKYSRPVDEIKLERKEAGFENKELQRITKYLYGEYIGKNSRFKAFRKRLQMLKLVLQKKHNWDWYVKNVKDVYRIKKDCYDIRFYNKNIAMTQKEYNEIAVVPDYSKKYIYFGLQLSPEETTIPRAGVFSEQYISVQLLAKAAEKAGVMLYVKEHFVQPFRNKYMYEMLSEIPNVQLVKTTESSLELMKHCIAVATQTGTCILEGAIKGKPALVTSSGYCWKGLPTVYEVTNEDQGAEIIQSILNGCSVEKDEVEKYFYAIQENTIDCYLQKDYMNQQYLQKHKESVTRIMKCLEGFLNEIEK